MELNEREAHCIARLLQGAIFSNDVTDGCFFCKYPCEHEAVFAREIRNRLTEETGVDLGVMNAGGLPKSGFPHGRFLRNSHENTKKLYKDSFKWLLDTSF